MEVEQTRKKKLRQRQEASRGGDKNSGKKRIKSNSQYNTGRAWRVWGPTKILKGKKGVNLNSSLWGNHKTKKHKSPLATRNRTQYKRKERKQKKNQDDNYENGGRKEGKKTLLSAHFRMIDLVD